jgi:hypothetical protein
MRDLQLVIFDCDGVLVDSEVISNEVLARALTAEGLPTTLAQAAAGYADAWYFTIIDGIVIPNGSCNHCVPFLTQFVHRIHPRGCVSKRSAQTPKTASPWPRPLAPPPR